MDEFYTKIQVYLIKKDRECEKLRFLTSRTTPSNEAHVSEVCDTIKTILKDSTSSNTDDKSIKNFKFLLLNTNFRAQEHLCEDIANGHLVDMCPPLSPYLFIQILWALDYDDIMCNSILYIPIDLSSEILDTLRRCLDLDFQRSFNVALKVIENCYKKLILTIDQNTPVLDEQESLKRFIGSIQELISLLADLQSKKIEGLSPLIQYQRRGWVLIRLLNTIKDCIATRRENSPIIGDEESEKLYRVTFGKNYLTRMDPNFVSEAVDTFSKELIDLLLNNVKKIDCYVYMGWAELDYDDDSSISMQRAVGLSCYNFVEFLEADEKERKEYSHVIECLKQLSSKPDAPFSMSPGELCSEVAKGNRECLRKLIQRFVEWDSTMISCLDVNQAFIDKGECLSLLNSTVKFLEICSEDELCAEVYGTAMKILLGQRLADMVEIIVEFILIHNAGRGLESINFEPDLKSYINSGLALCSSKNSLKIFLCFFIQNPREVLKTLIRAAIGYPEYIHSVILPESLCKLSTVMKIRDFNGFSVLSNSLREIFTDNVPWDGKKFVNLMRVFLDKKVLSADDLVNDVFISGLQDEIILENIQSIITCFRTMNNDITRKMKKQELLHVLALQISYLRKKNDLSIHGREEVLHSLIRIIHHFSNAAINPTVDYRDSFSKKLEASLEPLDKIYFAPNWGWIRNEISLNEVIPDYKRRCVHAINETKPVKNRFADIEDVLEAHSLGTDDFLQHLILQFTEFEYLRFGKEVLIMHLDYFGWENELDAYAQFSLATIKACRNNFESFDPINSCGYSSQKFSTLVKSLAKLTTWFINIDVMTDYASVHQSLVLAMNVLNLSTTFYQKFKTCQSQSMDTVYSYQMVADLVHNVYEFGDQISRHYNQPVANTDPRSLTVLKFYLNSRFISICLNWPMEENILLLSKIDKKLYSKR